MKNEQILKKAIEKAIKNGYKFPFAKDFLWKDETLFGHTWWAAVIFSHDFAKAFWGTDWSYRYYNTESKKIIDLTRKFKYKHLINLGARKMWQYHLQQMVLEKDPLKYLEKFLKEKEQ